VEVPPEDNTLATEGQIAEPVLGEARTTLAFSPLDLSEFKVYLVSKSFPDMCCHCPLFIEL